MTLKNKPDLKAIAFNSCKLSTKSLEVLATSLKDNEILKELFLYSNDLTTDDAYYIA